MRIVSVLFLLLVFCFPAFSNQNAEIIINKSSNNNTFQSTLKCKTKISVGSFQDCWLILFHAYKPVPGAEVFITGGMPQHQHGLPTTPQVVWSKEKNAYQINGLKFSMPGKWSLNFMISSGDGALKDQIVLSVEVK